jgi:hypothetical protein
MARLPQPTIDAIYKHYESLPNEDRGYLGGSELGEECSRRLWYGFRQVGRARPDGRILRLFETGHREEARVIDNLRAIGCEVFTVDEATGKQYRYTECDGHLSGGLDGVVLGLPEAPETPHLLECKTANKKSFDAMEKDGVAKSKPVHMAQVQLYMGMAGLARAAYVVVCKDDDRLYLERVEFDAKMYKALLLKARSIIQADSPPEKVSQDPAFYVCKFCPYADNCHGERMPMVSCRTCVHSAPAKDAAWTCGMGRDMVPDCGGHLVNPALLPWAEPVDGTEEWVQYRIRANNRQFVNVADVGFAPRDLPMYASAELVRCVPAAIGDPAVEAARVTLGAVVVEARNV